MGAPKARQILKHLKHPNILHFIHFKCVYLFPLPLFAVLLSSILFARFHLICQNFLTKICIAFFTLSVLSILMCASFMNSTILGHVINWFGRQPPNVPPLLPPLILSLSWPTPPGPVGLMHFSTWIISTYWIIHSSVISFPLLSASIQTLHNFTSLL